MKFRAFLLLILSFTLFACGGSDEGDSSSSSDEPLPYEVMAPLARDSYDQLLTANQPNANNEVSLRDRVSDPQGLAMRLVAVRPLTSQCQLPHVNSEALSFRVDNRSADACTYTYTIENVPNNGATPKQTQATSYVVISTTSTPAMLPILSHTAVVNETISIELASELGGNFPVGFTLQPEVIVLGSGTAVAEPASNTINYTAAAVPGITRLIYSYLSADGTEVRAGAIDVSVSKAADGMPLAKNFPGPEDVLPGAVVTVDVKEHISDPDGDSLQLTDAYAFDATVSATDPMSLTNTRFDFVAEKPGSYDVSYYVTDHNGGYAIGVVRITVKAKSLWSDIILSDGSRYTAPWEKNLADDLGIPYQDFYEETNASGTYQVALFNYEAALTLCAARGMVLPTIVELDQLHSEKPDPSGSDNWPVERPYWTGETLDSSNNGQVYDLVSGRSSLNPIYTPAGVTCIYSGMLSGLETTVDNQYVIGGPTSSTHDEVEALVTSGNGTPLASKNVYFYSPDANLRFSQKQVMTDADGKAKIMVDSLIAGTFTVYANYLTQTLNTAVTFIENLVNNLTISGDNEVRMGESINLTAWATYESSDVENVTAEADWSSNAPSLAAVDSGVVIGNAPGTVDISASLSGVNAAVHPVTVYAGLGRLEVMPSSVSLDVGETVDLTATAHFDDGMNKPVTSESVWTSTNAMVASVVGGKVTANSSGSATIQARYTDSHNITQVGNAEITVTKSVDHAAISPSSKTFNASDSGMNFTHTVYYTDGTTNDVSSNSIWLSSDPSVASVNMTTGFVKPLSAGNATIVAQYSENGIAYNSTSVVTVINELTSLSVSPTTASLTVNETQQLAVTAHYRDGSSRVVTSAGATYSSSNTAVATVNATGLVTAKAAGAGTVTATFSDAGTTKSAAMSLTVMPEDIVCKADEINVPNVGCFTRSMMSAVKQYAAAEAYCEQFGADYEVPSIGQLRELYYGVGAPGVLYSYYGFKNSDYYWTKTSKTTDPNYRVVMNAANNDAMNWDHVTGQTNWVTCIRPVVRPPVACNIGEVSVNGIGCFKQVASAQYNLLQYNEAACRDLNNGSRVPTVGEISDLYYANQDNRLYYIYGWDTSRRFYSSTLTTPAQTVFRISFTDGGFDYVYGGTTSNTNGSCIRTH